MTKQQAIELLDKTEVLSTDLLMPLGISFEWFLTISQYPREQYLEIIRKLIVKLNKGEV